MSRKSTVVRFQALPPLSPDEYAALERSILDNGVLVSVLIDENDVVIDGHHRQKIAKHHNLPCPYEVMSGFTDAEKRTLSLSLNLDRRHLTREQHRALVAESIKADPQLSDREHGRRTGVDHKTATKVRDQLEGRGEIPHVSERADSLGRQQPASKPPRPQPEQKPRRKPITETFNSAAHDLRHAVERVARLVADDRLEKNKDQIVGANLSDLIRARDAINGVIQQLEG